MRLLVLWPDRQEAGLIREKMEALGWEAEARFDGRSILPWNRVYDVLLLHLCLPGMDGLSAGELLAASPPARPPRILFAAPPEWCVHRPDWADCTVAAGGDLSHLCQLIQVLSRKPLSRLAMAQQKPLEERIERFLDELSFPPRLKGRTYAAWLLRRMTPATSSQEPSLGQLYAACARELHTTPAAVERCLRAAVETVFTQGSLEGIERFFGATVDPERGKPTNRAFLMQAVEQLRYSLTTSLSPNNSEMHQSPAAPTSV